MSTPQRRNATGLIDQLVEAPQRFEFFQAVRLLERWLEDDQPRARGDVLPHELRFRSSTALSFPASEVESLQVLRKSPESQSVGASPDDVDSIQITPAFMGLLGLAGTLPLVYTEQILQHELLHKDESARGFLDLFNHRAVSLFYAAWKKSRLPLQYEADRRSRFAPMVLALAGVGQKALHDRLQPHAGGVDDESLAFFAGALQQRALSAAQLQQMLSRYLKVAVRVEQFCGRWYTLPKEARTSLGLGNGVLGKSALSGERVWQRDLRVRLVLGPLTHDLFQRFLPGAPGATALRELLALLSGSTLEYEVNLTLRADAVEGCALGSDRSPLMGRLGWDTYLQTRTHAADRCDVRYDIH